MRVNKSRDLLVGGYVENGKNFDSIVVGYYEGADLLYVARVRNGFTPSLRDAVFKKFRGLETPNCPFVNLPQRDKGRWGEGLTTEKMVECRWLKPRLTVQIEYAEWTDGNHLRHSKFIALRDDQNFGHVTRESPTSK
jgi:bifunctional non-homologous end joining protein LigD